MTKEERIARCRELKKSVNCAQAVALGFADVVGVDEDVLARCTQAYGGGMGTMDGTCGTIVGAGMIIGLVSADRPSARKTMAEVMTRFKERNGATVCRVLKGVDTGCPLRACPDCVADSAEILYDALHIDD